MSALRTLGFFKPSVLGGIDALGLMMIAIMILIFGPLATIEPSDVSALAGPLAIAFAFAFGVLGIGLFSGLVGKLLGYSIPMSVAIGLTSLYGLPGTTDPFPGGRPRCRRVTRGGRRHRARDPPQNDRRRGSSAVTIASVIVTRILAGHIGRS